MSFSRAQLLNLPGVNAMAIASQAKLGNYNFGDLVMDESNIEGVKLAAKSGQNKDLWNRYCKAYLACKALAEVLPPVMAADAAAGANLSGLEASTDPMAGALVLAPRVRKSLVTPQITDAPLVPSQALALRPVVTEPPAAPMSSPEASVIDKMQEQLNAAMASVTRMFQKPLVRWFCCGLMLMFPKLVTMVLMTAFRSVVVTGMQEFSGTVKDTGIVAMNVAADVASGLETAAKPITNLLGESPGMEHVQLANVTATQSVFLAGFCSVISCLYFGSGAVTAVPGG